MNERGPCCQSEIRDRYSPVKRLLSYTLYFFSYSVTKCKVLVVAPNRERERHRERKERERGEREREREERAAIELITSNTSEENLKQGV